MQNKRGSLSKSNSTAATRWIGLLLSSDTSANTSVSHTHNHSRSVAVLLVSLVPCIAVVILVDLFQLARPGDGLSSSHVLWFRALLSTALIAFMLLQQMRTMLPDLGIRQVQIVVITVAVAAGGTAWAIGLSSLVGYPLPFTFAAGSPVFMAILTSSVLLLWGGRVRKSRRLRHQLIQYLFVVVVQWALTLVYPVFNYAFLQANSLGQTAFAVVLPMVKMLMKYWLASLLRNLPDLVPGFVILNVEVFHALFVTYCMQNATSIWTNVAIMALDALHAWASIYDINTQINKLADRLQNAKIDTSDRETTPQHSPPPLVDSAVYLLRDRDTLTTIQTMAATRPLEPHSSSVVGIASIVPTESAFFQHATLVGNPPGPIVKDPTLHLVLAGLPVVLTAAETHLLDALSAPDRVAFVQDVLALLHMTEFLLLIEYVEIIIPIIYSVYLFVVFHLPNRVYYPQLRDISAEQLHQVVQNVMLYAALEFVSFVVLSVVLRRKVRFAPVHQLTFVLSTQWHIVQAKLILWLVYMVQVSLVHFGVDYTFQFKWLQNSTYFD